MIRDFIFTYIGDIINGILCRDGMNWFDAIWRIALVTTIPAVIQEILSSSDRIGKKYEKLVAKILRNKLNVKVLRNVLIPSNRVPLGKTEADMVFVSTKGVFCIECKHRTFESEYDEQTDGWGRYNSEDWPIMKNPFIQNRTHIKALNTLIPETENKTFNTVIVNYNWSLDFMGLSLSAKNNNGLGILRSENAFMVKIERSSVFSRILDPGIYEFKKELQKMPDILTKDEVKEIYDQLSKYKATRRDMKAFKNAHKKMQLEMETEAMIKQWEEEDRLKEAKKALKKKR